MIFRKRRYLAPYFTRQRIANMELADEEAPRIPALLEKWEKARASYMQGVQAQSGIHSTIEVRPFSESMQGQARELVQDIRFQNAYGNRLYEFAWVEIDKLVAYQKFVNLDFAEELEHRLPETLSESALFDFCIALEKKSAPVSHLRLDDEYTHLFSSDSHDFRVTDVVARPVDSKEIRDMSSGVPTHALTVFLGFGLPIASAYQLKDRIVVWNGFHRLFALRKRGLRFAPVLLLRDPSIKALRALNSEIPVEVLLSEKRPPIMQDFFNEDLVLDVLEKPKRRAIKLSVDIDMMDVPM